MPSRPAKTWRFTLNNWTPEDRKFFENLDCTRCVFGEEEGKEGTPHLQGIVTFKRAYRLAGLKKLTPRTHWEIAMCDDHNYELKGENVFIKDERRQGHRSDLDDVAEMIKNGNSLEEVAKAYPTQYIKYHRGIQELKKIFVTEVHKGRHDLDSCCERLGVEPLKFNGVTEVVVGPPGCGKTQYALAHFENPLFVRHKQQLEKFKPGEHDGIVFDDMDFKHWPVDVQKHLTDWDEPSDIDIKYGVARIPCNTRKVMTCNEICVNIEDPAVARRVTVTKVGEGNTDFPQDTWVT